MKLLEVTLRDGSYAIDFKFTPKDTAIIASSLEQAGFELIEIGHGLGLHAKEMGKGDAAASDIDYIEAAVSVLKRAKFGMFCIPGIARLEDIDMAASAGVDFIRIGTNITELKGTNKYFERAKKHGMFISSNLMKSYVVAPEEFGKYTKLAQEYGADIAVLVDSAGTFTPGDIENYYKSSRDICDVSLGFHGHNNLGLANANTLKAIQLGAEIVDTSMKGIGRSAGNAVTEMMIMILKKLKYRLNIDEYAVMDLAEKYITPLLHNVKNTPISITGGYAQFHSSFLGTIMKYADKYRVDPRELIIKVTKKDKVHANEDLVEKLAHEIKKGKDKTTSKKISPVSLEKFTRAKKEEKPRAQIKVLINEIVNESKKKGKRAVFNIVLSDSDLDNNYISEFIQENPLFFIGSMEITNYEYFKKIVEYIDGKVDYILLDSCIKRTRDKDIINNIINDFKESKILLYNDLQIWSKSVVSLITGLLGRLIDKEIIIYGDNKFSNYVKNQLEALGAYVIVCGYSSHKNFDIKNESSVIISCDSSNKMPKSFVKKFKKIDIIIDAKIDSIDENCVNYINKIGLKLIRPDMRAVIAGESLHLIINENMIKNDLGRTKIKGHNVISGGLVGKKNEIIVDSISSPTQVIGIARGNGKVNYSFDKKQQKIIQEIENFISLSK